MIEQSNRAILPVVLAGGSGSRLWPISTPNYPKQFLALFDKFSFLQKTIKRVSTLLNVLNPLIICGEQHLSLVRSHLDQISVDPLAIITEPIGRNTAPAVTLAALQQVEQLNDPILLILPSDHMIADEKTFKKAILSASIYAEQGKLVTFGIMPDHPNVNYGYIKVGKALDAKLSFFSVEKFVEKPNLETAKKYLKSMQYHWNSGMFMFRASFFLKELLQFDPHIVYCCELMKSALAFEKSKKTYKVPLSVFQLCPKKSIDYAVMEKTQNAVIMPIDIGWNDIGTWRALWRYHPKDSNGNAIWGNADLTQVENSLIYAKDRSISLEQVSNRVIVHANNEVFESDL
jgi:mannose-1-phosphate guanylyltransferase